MLMLIGAEMEEGLQVRGQKYEQKKVNKQIIVSNITMQSFMKKKTPRVSLMFVFATR